MILLDTHVWIWWVHGDGALKTPAREAIELSGEDGTFVSAISCWEVAKLIERQRLDLPLPIESWMEMALEASGVVLIALSPRIAIESTQLPGKFHRDPADQIIVATSRVHGLPLLTFDQKIREYPYVTLAEELRIHDR